MPKFIDIPCGGGGGGGEWFPAKYDWEALDIIFSSRRILPYQSIRKVL